MDPSFPLNPRKVSKVFRRGWVLFHFLQDLCRDKGYEKTVLLKLCENPEQSKPGPAFCKLPDKLRGWGVRDKGSVVTASNGYIVREAKIVRKKQIV